ncbi:MAG: OmpA family protein, partial [Chitinophagales bacterium]
MLAIGFALWLWLIRNNGIAEVSNYVAGEEQIDSAKLAKYLESEKQVVSSTTVTNNTTTTTTYTPPPTPTQISTTNTNSSYNIYPQYLFFGFNKSNLTTENQLKLDRLYGLIHQDEAYTLEADGYADQKGSDAYNLVLSKKRAETAINYLIAKGLPQGRIQVVGHGKDQSSTVVNDDYASIMSKDEFERRVELILKLNGKRVNLKDKIAELEKAPTPEPVFPDTTQENLITKYYHLYRILHQEQQEAFEDDTLNIQRRQFITTDTLADGIEVFGWHPYWMGDAYKSYSYNLLSTIAYFSYDVDPTTGSYRTDEAINDWKTTALVDSAKASGSKILLTVTNHGYFNNKQLLDNEQAQNVLIDSLVSLVSLRGGDGVDIDFEVIPKGYKDKLTKFIQRLSSTLKAKNASNIISVDLPAVDHFDSFDITALDKYVDLFVIMGYDYHGATGP